MEKKKCGNHVITFLYGIEESSDIGEMITEDDVINDSHRDELIFADQLFNFCPTCGQALSKDTILAKRAFSKEFHISFAKQLYENSAITLEKRGSSIVLSSSIAIQTIPDINEDIEEYIRFKIKDCDFVIKE